MQIRMPIFAIYDEREKLTMKEATNEMPNLNSSLNIGSEEMPIDNMCKWQERELLMQSTTWQSW